MLFLSSLPLWGSVFVLVGITTALAMLGPIVVRRSYSLDRLVTNNEVAGFKFAVIGVIYAVMLGFAVIVVWEKFSEGEQAVVSEAGAVAALYRLSNGLDAVARPAVRDRLTAYVNSAIAEDWPAMGRARVAAGPSQALTALYAAVLAIPSGSLPGGPVMEEIFHQMDSVTAARRHRLILAEGIVPPVLWAALWAGAGVTIGFTFFFGTHSLRAQTLMTGLLAFLIFLVLFVIVEIDHPFTGPVSVRPGALELVLRDLGGEPVP